MEVDLTNDDVQLTVTDPKTRRVLYDVDRRRLAEYDPTKNRETVLTYELDARRTERRANSRWFDVTNVAIKSNITFHDAVTLWFDATGGRYLNDEIINGVFNEDNRKEDDAEKPKVLSSHFYTKLRGEHDTEKLKRWFNNEEGIDAVSEYRMMFIPIHQGSHWSAVVLHRKRSDVVKLFHIDSITDSPHDPTVILNKLMKFFQLVYPKGTTFELSSLDRGKQTDDFQCGVWTILFIYHSWTKTDEFIYGAGKKVKDKMVVNFRSKLLVHYLFEEGLQKLPITSEEMEEFLREGKRLG